MSDRLISLTRAHLIRIGTFLICISVVSADILAGSPPDEGESLDSYLETWASDSREDSLLGTKSDSSADEDLEQRAALIELQYPWLVQETFGLSLSATDVPREDFLNGLHAATDLVFDGSALLPERISLEGVFNNISEVIRELCSNNLSVDYEEDLESLRVQFIPGGPAALGSGQEDPHRKYRMPRPLVGRAPPGSGYPYPGVLIVEGVVFPSPLSIEVIPKPEASQIYVRANLHLMERFEYVNTVLLDQALLGATDLATYESAFRKKADLLWSEIGKLPFEGQGDRLRALSTQASIQFPNIYHASPQMGGLVIQMLDRKTFRWDPPIEPRDTLVSEQRAVALAMELRDRMVAGLTSAGYVFFSRRSGLGILYESPALLVQLQVFARDPLTTLREKEREIRIRWPNHAEWILELFYTSLVTGPASESPRSLSSHTPPVPIPYSSSSSYPIHTPDISNNFSELRGQTIQSRESTSPDLASREIDRKSARINGRGDWSEFNPDTVLNDPTERTVTEIQKRPVGIQAEGAGAASRPGRVKSSTEGRGWTKQKFDPEKLLRELNGETE